MPAQVDLTRRPEIQHQLDLTAHMVPAEHAVQLHRTVRQAQCHPVDRQGHTNHLLQAVVLLAVEFVHREHLAHIVVHTDQLVLTVQCHLAVRPHGSRLGGLKDEVAP